MSASSSPATLSGAGFGLRNQLGRPKLDEIGDFIVAVLRAVVIMLLWGWIFYVLGYAVLWVFTFGKYPKNLKLQGKANLVSCMGFLFLIALWFALAGYNNSVRPS